MMQILLAQNLSRKLTRTSGWSEVIVTAGVSWRDSALHLGLKHFKGLQNLMAHHSEVMSTVWSNINTTETSVFRASLILLCQQTSCWLFLWSVCVLFLYLSFIEHWRVVCLSSQSSPLERLFALWRTQRSNFWNRSVAEIQHRTVQQHYIPNCWSVTSGLNLCTGWRWHILNSQTHMLCDTIQLQWVHILTHKIFIPSPKAVQLRVYK